MEERKQVNCPKCGQIIYRENNTLRCISNNCTWETPARRVKDKEVPTISELKQTWA